MIEEIRKRFGIALEVDDPAVPIFAALAKIDEKIEREKECDLSEVEELIDSLPEKIKLKLKVGIENPEIEKEIAASIERNVLDATERAFEKLEKRLATMADTGDAETVPTGMEILSKNLVLLLAIFVAGAVFGVLLGTYL